VKRISSTRRKRRPKQGGELLAPEIVEVMKSLGNSPVPAAVAPAATGPINLGVACTIHEAQALRTHLLAQLELPGPHEIDGSDVQQIDTAGVQLVLAFALDCLERNVRYAWKGRSPALEEAIRVLGVGALLECPS
jgi:anti-anti-sigma regulatory factor